MGAPADDGPDGSSIRPVSSLLARFENMNQSNPLPPPQNTPSRPISPAPKPDRLRSFKPNQDAQSTPSMSSALAATGALKVSAAIPIPRPPQSRMRSPQNSLRASESSSVPHAFSRPQSASSSILTASDMPPPPAVKVQPPQSPPEAPADSLSVGGRSPFLDPVLASSPEFSVGSPTPIKLPSRPITPVHLPSSPRSSRQSFSRPPSPPPPRRSGDLRREGRQPPAPPAPRLDRSKNAAQGSTKSHGMPQSKEPSKPYLTEEVSPFNSPPTSPEKEASDEHPPRLPTRPKKGTAGHEGPEKSMAPLNRFEPPPSHHQSLARRAERDLGLNGPSHSALHQSIVGDERVNQAPKRSASDLVSHMYNADNTAPPPKPPRPAQRGASQTLALSASGSSRRLSQSSSAHAFPASSSRNHGALKPADRVLDEDDHPNNIPPPSKNRQVPRSISPEAPAGSAESVDHITTFPDVSNVNRRPPHVKKGASEIITRYDPRIFDVCGKMVCTSGQLTRTWDLADGEQVMSLSHTEGVKATSVIFRPAADPDHEGQYVWIGTNLGELMEVEVATQRIGEVRTGVHSKAEIIKLHRHFNEIWSLDEGGTLNLWPAGADGLPSLAGRPITQVPKLPRGHTISLVIGDELWYATGKLIRVFEPSIDGARPFQVLVRPLSADGCADVSAGTLLASSPGHVYFGHLDGKVSIFSTRDYTCLKVLNISSWKINGMAGVGHDVWAAFNTGKICVYDTSSEPWIVKKEWQAHDHSVFKLAMDPSSAYQMDRLQVLSLGADNKVKIWDGMLQDTWLEDDVKSKDIDYCEFEQIKAMVFTWNAGATTPHSLRYSDGDATFFRDLVQSSGSPDILVFGFQELVDLEDKTATAKRLFKSKKKEGSDQDRMSHQYRDWRDFLLKTLDDYMPSNDLYHLLQSSPLVGLFTCVFVKSTIRDRIRNLHAAEIKRGMGGLHGNKGAIVVRFKVDDTSLCFVNCHLAAGQSQANSRHNDIAAILEAGIFPTERDSEIRLDTFTGGGDGSMILDHELCILNGDLNYRIDTMSRDTVVKAVQQDQLSKLLERDQLLVARRRNPAFRLRSFEELPITFAPTYKYDVGKDTYDTSEKRRSPAWCDRLLYRGRNRVRQLDYRRHEVRVSDHRPVTGSFVMWVKKVDARSRARAWMESQDRFEDVQTQVIANEKLAYLVGFCGYDEATSHRLIQERSSPRRVNRSPSRGH